MTDRLETKPDPNNNEMLIVMYNGQIIGKIAANPFNQERKI
jgi:hypothetical protein